ncbi:MAG TPA: amidohydrolase [Vicinamibacterales bacterium]|nr:amidohydrolase [Vicinamibacterales bacterium]
MSGPITLAVVNARLWTGDQAAPWAEALAVSGERLIAVGTNADIRRLASTVTPIDAGGRLVLPGFIDAHVHFLEGGLRRASVQLRDARSRDEFVNRIRAFTATVPAGTWITGGDWDHSLWGGELPSRDWIDPVTPNHPVWINRLDGHMNLANSAALKAAGVTRATADVTGGEIVRRADGEPTGLLKDNAMALVDKVAPPASPEMRRRAVTAAMRYVAERGVTTVHDMSTSAAWDDMALYADLRKANALQTRIYSVVPLAQWERLRDVVARGEYGGADGRGDEWLRVGGLKGFVDGSLGSHTAAFNEPFTDMPNDRGLLVNTPDDLYRWISGADKAGLHVMVHAIGDRANRLLLDTFERVATENGARDRRFRIEHAQHLAPSDIPRFAALNVIASMQPYHAIDDGRWAEKYIGDRIKTTYAFRSLIDARATVAFGSDWFVAPPTPLEGIYAAVTRRTLDGKNTTGWVPQQKITVEEAVRAYTANAAYASFDESRKGILSKGRLADFVMLERNIFEIPPEEIGAVRVRMTIVGGRPVFDAKP